MGRLYLHNLKLYYKMWYVSLLQIPIYIYFFMRFFEIPSMAIQPTAVFNISAQLCAVYGLLGFVYFLFSSYEFFSKASDRGMKETVDSLTGGSRKVFFSQLLVQLAVVGVFYIIGASLVIAFALKNLSFSYGLFINILLSTVLYLLGPILVGMLIGAVCAARLKRIPFYTVGIVLTFLLSPFSQYLHIAGGYTVSDLISPWAGKIFLQILGLISRQRPIYSSATDIAYGQSLEPFRWQLLLFWVFFLFAIILWRLRKKKKPGMKIASGVLAALCIFSLWGYLNPGSNWAHRVPMTIEDSINNEEYFYYDLQGFSKQNEMKPPEFSVTACSINLSMFKELSATAALTLDGKNLKEYDFTLYHGYRVTGVRDGDGKALSFRRWHDYLTVENPGQEPIKEIIVEYRGNHTTYYASAQGCYLPGYAAYYPVEGRYNLFNQGIVTSCVPPTEREFKMKVSGMCDFFSDLERTRDGSFSGRARVATVVGGMYKEEEANGVKNILPTYKKNVDLIGNVIKELETLSTKTGIAIEIPKIKTVLFSPSSRVPNLEKSSDTSGFAGETLLLYSSADSNQYSRLVSQLLRASFSAPEEKQVCADLLVLMTQGMMMEQNNVLWSFQSDYGAKPGDNYIKLEDLDDSLNAQREVGFYIYKALLGTKDYKPIFQAIGEYLEDGSDTRSSLEFAKALAVKYTKK